MRNKLGFLFLLVLSFIMILPISKTYAYTDQLSTNLLDNATSMSTGTYTFVSTDYVKYTYENINITDLGIVIFDLDDQSDVLFVQVKFYDATDTEIDSKNIIERFSTPSILEYYAYNNLENVTYFDLILVLDYGSDTTTAQFSRQNWFTNSFVGDFDEYITALNNSESAYNQGVLDMYNNGATANGLLINGSYDYNEGYDEGQNRMYNNGSDTYEYDETGSYDYEVGYNQGQEDGYNQGQDDMFNNGSSIYGYVLENAYDYILGYDTGQDDMYDNGSVTYGYTPDSSYDYDRGLNDGKQVNVNAGTINFMESFETWIVPAIVVVILLGGFMTIAVKKRNQD